MQNKAVYIIAGPNGSGKTTFARLFLPDYVNCPNFVNADFIAQGLAPFGPRAAAIKAGKLLYYNKFMNTRNVELILLLRRLYRVSLM